MAAAFWALFAAAVLLLIGAVGAHFGCTFLQQFSSTATGYIRMADAVAFLAIALAVSRLLPTGAKKEEPKAAE